MKKVYLIIAVILFASCEHESSTILEPNELVYQDLLVRYEYLPNDKTRTIAQATFRRKDKSGVRLKLENEKSILFNKEGYKSFSTIFDYFYTWEYDGIIQKGEFNFIKDKDRRFVNAISHSEIVATKIPSSFTKVKIDKNNELLWEGSPLKQGENIQLYFKQGEETGGSSFVSTEGAKKIEFGEIILDKLKKGKAVLYLKRSTVLDSNKIESDGKNNVKRTVEIVVTKEIEIE